MARILVDSKGTMVVSWVHCKVQTTIAEDDTTTNTISVQNSCATTQLIMYHADWKKLKTTVAWILRVKTILLELSQKRKQLLLDDPTDLIAQEMMKAKRSVGRDLSTEDLSAAETAVIQFCQRERFNSDMGALLSGNPVKRSSPIYKLNPVLEDVLLRVGGRLSRTAMPEGRKHPIILLKGQNISLLILKHIHEQTGHSGRNCSDCRCNCSKELLVNRKGD